MFKSEAIKEHFHNLLSAGSTVELQLLIRTMPFVTMELQKIKKCLTESYRLSFKEIHAQNFYGKKQKLTFLQGQRSKVDPKSKYRLGRNLLLGHPSI